MFSSGYNIATHAAWLSSSKKAAVHLSIVRITGLDWIFLEPSRISFLGKTNMLVACLVLCFFFVLAYRFAVSFISWGISFSAPFLGGDVYVNVVISAVASLPGLPLCAALTVW